MSQRTIAMLARTAPLAAVVIAAGILAVAAAEEKAPAAPAPPAAGDEAAKQAARVATVPDAEKNRKNSVPATPESIENGRSLYSTQCAMCHGTSGDGKGELVERLNLKMPDFTNAAQMKKRTDGELRYILNKGHGDMPPETRLEEKELWDLINCIRSQAGGVKK